MEFVYVVERKNLFGRGKPPIGFFPIGKSTRAFEENVKHRGFFIERSYVEEDDRFLQIIPYVVISKGQLVLTYQRKLGDARLVNKVSVGVGGHVNPIDKGSDCVVNAAHRELGEEIPVLMDKNVNLWPVGYVYNSNDAVGRVHFGFVYKLDVESTSLQIDDLIFDTEEGIGKVKYVSDIKLTSVEAWSAYCLRSLFSWNG